MSSRSYCIGLPVVVTVHDDGRVDYEVDTSEASSDLYEGTPTDEQGTPLYSEAEEAADAAAISADHDRRVTKEVPMIRSEIPPHARRLFRATPTENDNDVMYVIRATAYWSARAEETNSAEDCASADAWAARFDLLTAKKES